VKWSVVNLSSYIYTGKVSVTFCDTNVDIVDFIKAAEELLFPQLVASLERYIIDMYLMQSQSTKSFETEAWLQPKIVRLITLKMVK